MKDRIHQPFRAEKIPGLREALAYDAPGVRGIALSGAGPTVLMLLDRHADARRIGAEMRALFTAAGIASSTLSLRPSARGFIFRKSAETA